MMSATDDIRNRPIFKYLLIQSFVLAITTHGWGAISTNFAVNEAGLSGQQFGVIQSFRELPGLLSVSLLFWLSFMSEMRLMSLSVVLAGVGTALLGFFPTFSGIMGWAVCISIGLHYSEAISQSLTLQHFSIKESPLIIGYLRSATAAGSFFIGFLLFILSGGLEWLLGNASLFNGWFTFLREGLAFEWLFCIVAVGSIIGGIWGLTQKDIPAAAGKQLHRMILKKKYSLYYVLTMCSGARRQVFMVFSVLLLVERFNFSLRTMTMLFLLNNLINWGLNRYVGKAINYFGERSLLTVKYLILIAVFFTYACSDSAWLVLCMYIIEQLFFNFTVAIRTFFQKIAEPQDIAPSMALGLTINHIVAVVLPVIGGVLWMQDYRLPFYMGVAFAGCSLFAVQFIDKDIKNTRNSQNS